MGARKLATPPSRSRRQTSLRLLRLREAAGVTQAEIGSCVGVTKRAMGSIERAEVRMVALQAFFTLFDHVVRLKGLDAALGAILTEEQQTLVAERSVHLSGVPQMATESGTRQGTVASSNGQGLRGTLRLADVVKPALNPTEGESPSCSANQSVPIKRRAA